jgi:beta-lactamase superfamily II metal-dependent hydrolase
MGNKPVGSRAKKPGFFGTRLAAFLLAAAMAFSFASCEFADEFMDSLLEAALEGESAQAQPAQTIPAPPAQPAPAAPGQAGLEVCIIDVGQADAIFIECEGEKMLIDGGNAADSNLIYSFLEKRGASALKYVVGTHAHEDHIGGLPGALRYATAGTVYCPVTTFSSSAFDSFVEAVASQKKRIIVPKAGQKLKLGSASLEVLGPLRPSDEPNNMSIVLKLTYGSVSFLFSGDAESAEEAEIVASGAKLAADVYKVGHHGSAGSSSKAFLNAVKPSYALISCGLGNKYGHPAQSALDRLKAVGASVYRTDKMGDIHAFSDGVGIWFQTEKGRVQEAAPAEFVGNSRSKSFHVAGCPSMPAASNQSAFAKRKEAIAAGFAPCAVCLP